MNHEQPDGSDSPEQEREAEHVDDLLDEAGKESFPASDPVAVTPTRRHPDPGGGPGDDRGDAAGGDEPRPDEPGRSPAAPVSRPPRAGSA